MYVRRQCTSLSIGRRTTPWFLSILYSTLCGIFIRDELITTRPVRHTISDSRRLVSCAFRTMDCANSLRIRRGSPFTGKSIHSSESWSFSCLFLHSAKFRSYLISSSTAAWRRTRASELPCTISPPVEGRTTYVSSRATDEELRY